jgi:hypothetical protein
VGEVNNLSGVLHSLHNVVLRLEELEEDGGSFHTITQINHFASCHKTLSDIRRRFDESKHDKNAAAMPTSRRDKVRSLLEGWHMKRLLLEIERHKQVLTLALGVKNM